MSTNYIGKNSLARFLEKLYETFSKKGHAHSKADILDLPSFEGLATEDYVDNEISDAISEIEPYILNIDYEATLAFDTSEVIFGTNMNTSSVLGQAILGQMILA